jgi:hypothetical protein
MRSHSSILSLLQRHRPGPTPVIPKSSLGIVQSIVSCALEAWQQGTREVEMGENVGSSGKRKGSLRADKPRVRQPFSRLAIDLTQPFHPPRMSSTSRSIPARPYIDIRRISSVRSGDEDRLGILPFSAYRIQAKRAHVVPVQLSRFPLYPLRNPTT